jgi:hypothetical protein
MMQLGWPILEAICMMHFDDPLMRPIMWFMVFCDALRLLV